jgi:hypothetical protein
MNDASQAAFRWTTHHEPAALLERTVEALLTRCLAAARLAARMRDETGTRLIDWIDHLAVPADELAPWRAAGFIGRDDRLRHPGGRFPTVTAGAPAIAIRVESVADCCAALGCAAPIAGAPGPGMRRALLAEADGVSLFAVERLGSGALAPTSCPPSLSVAATTHLERFRCRERHQEHGFARTRELITAAVADLGRDAACDLFFAAERDYWQRRNGAARLQKARQDRLGLGWANHDHHTYRSSRACFAPLIACLELLGLVCRERFYAGPEAGWGAQVLEQPTTGIVIFADVDMSPDELRGDFAHQGMPEGRELGTVGLWCALHGEAFLDAGMHHLEATFDFGLACAQLAANGIVPMKPFTDYAHLRQCFTAGERWMVDPARIAALLREGRITSDQALRFTRDGAIGSHLEILERNLGYKGFNQHGVSDIIAATDPRRHLQRS